jgi:hypothetical protein
VDHTNNVVLKSGFQPYFCLLRPWRASSVAGQRTANNVAVKSGIQPYALDGNELIFGIADEVKKALRKPTKPERFDTLLALTYALKDNDYWMGDNECWEEGDEMEKAIKCLAKAWKTTLAATDDELGRAGGGGRGRAGAVECPNLQKANIL